MKRKILSLFIALTLVAAAFVNTAITDAEERTGEVWVDSGGLGNDISLSFQVKNDEGRYVADDYSGPLEDGYINIKTTIWGGNIATTNNPVNMNEYWEVRAYQGHSLDDILTFEYKDNGTWVDAKNLVFNKNNVVVATGNVYKYYRIKAKDGAAFTLRYMIKSQSGEDIGLNSQVKYVRVNSGSFLWNMNEQAMTTTAPATTTEKVTESQTTTEQTTESQTTVEETTESQTTIEETTTVEPTEVALTKVKVKKVYQKKLSAKKLKVKIKAVKGAKGYQIAVYKNKKKAKKNKKALVKKYTKKIKYTIKSKKLAYKKKLFIRVRAYQYNSEGEKVFGPWSKIKRVKIK